MKVLDCPSNLYRNTPCPPIPLQGNKKTKETPQAVRVRKKVFWKTSFIFKRKKKDQAQGKGKKFQKGL